MLNYKIVLFTFIPALLCSFFSPAQEVLTLEQAVKIALANNYDIRLYSNDKAISANNVNKAELLPAVTGTLASNTNIQNTKQTQSNGAVVSRNGAKNSSFNYGVGLNWRIFDGFSMFAAYDRLKELERLGEANLQGTVLTTVFDVVNTYYDIVRNQQQLHSFNAALGLSRLRLNTAINRYEIGRAAKLEVLAANVDLNTDTTNLLRQRDLITNGKIRLNTLLARDVATDFSVRDTIIISTVLKEDDLLASSLQQNPSLQVAAINGRIAELNLKEVKGARYPVVSVGTGYNFTNTQSELGFAKQSAGRGFNYGLNASINIFNGFLQKKNEKNAAIEIDNSRLDARKAELAIRSQLASAYQTYLTNLQLVKLEAGNQEIARQNLDITLEKYKLGSIAPVEFREAQRNYVDASARYANAQYDAKIAEITLKEISGSVDLQQ